MWLGLAGFAATLELSALSARHGTPRTRGARRLLPGLGVGVAFGFGVSAGCLRFVPDVVARFTPLPWFAGVVGLVLLALAQGLPWGIAGVIATLLRRAGAPRALAFAAAVYVATFGPAVFPWTPAGLVSPWPAMVQLADVMGERGVTLLMALTAGLVGGAATDAARARSLATAPALGKLTAAALIAAAMFLHGTFRMHAVTSHSLGLETARVALVQPSIPAETRWDPNRAAGILDELTALTRDAEARGADLTVWHETAYPYALAASSRRCPTGAGALLGSGVRGPVLTGLLMKAGPGTAHNAAAVCDAGDVLSEPYAKRRLLAFGESVPLASYAPWLRRIFVRGLGLVPGERDVILTAGRVRASVLICFEDILTDASRDAMSGRPNLLVNVTNDAWFEGSAESEMHLRLSALRAVELRRDLVRAVNFGPASWVDATGHVRAQDAAKGVLLVTPTLRDSAPTPFARFGDTPVLVTVALVLVAALADGRRRRAVAA